MRRFPCLQDCFLTLTCHLAQGLRTSKDVDVDLLSTKDYYQAFFWVLIDLIVELLVLIIKPFDDQTELKSSIK
jgi:quinol-cytochrome oxidoreductase complex cytochrome b subunit